MHRHKTYRRLFLAWNGDGPWPCFKFGNDVTKEAFTVHHEDEDEENNTKENLKPMHKGCHNSVHHKGRKNSPETIERMRQAALRRYEDPEQRKKASEIQQRRNSSEFSAKMSEAAKKTYEDPARKAANAEHLRRITAEREARRRA